MKYIFSCNYEPNGEFFHLWDSDSDDINYCYRHEMSDKAKADFKNCYNYKVEESKERLVFESNFNL